MRFDVKKFVFVGLEKKRSLFFKQAQKEGIIHFIDPKKSKFKEVPEELNEITAALKILRGLPQPKQVALDEGEAGHIANRIVHYKKLIDHLYEEQRMIKLEIARIEVFGNFAKEDLEFIEREGKRKIQFFFGKRDSTLLDTLPEEVIYVGAAHELNYFVSINPEPIHPPQLVEMHVEKTLGQCYKRLEVIRAELQSNENSLKSYAVYNTVLQQALIHKLNLYHLDVTKEVATALLDDSLFVIEGWVPVNKIPELEKLSQDSLVNVEEVAIEPSDQIPTYLENKGFSRIGEDLINIYDTPSATDKDPSLWVLLSFAFFFAFIVNDAGYGLIFLATVLYIHYRHPLLKGAKKRVLKLVTILGITCTLWGFLVTSFFGITFAPQNPVREFTLLNWLTVKKMGYSIETKDETYTYWIREIPSLKSVDQPVAFLQQAVSNDHNDDVSYKLMHELSDGLLLELALLIGILHVIASMLRYIFRNPINIGWILVIIGGYFYIPHYLQATSIPEFLFHYDRTFMAQIGLYLIYGGLSLVVLIALIKHKLFGILEVMTAVQIFSDILSYLRLYALALAGGIVASVINEATHTMPFIIAIFFLVISHLINITMAIMGGVIHGLRLNFLESYHYSFEGGGKSFKPLKWLN